MAVQITYKRSIGSPVPGTDSDQNAGYKREAMNKTGADLDVGLLVKQHSGIDSGVDLLSSTNDLTVGVTLNDQGRNPNGLGGTGAYASNRMLPIKCEGPVYVQCDQDMQPGDPVFVRFATTHNTGTGPSAGVIGAVRKDADTDSARKVKGARVLSKGTAASGVVEIYYSAVGENT